MSGAPLTELATALHRARLSCQAMPQVDSPWLDLDVAYAVQHAGVALREAAGAHLCGAKIGFTSRAEMAQMGVHEMIIGQLTDAIQVEDGGAFPRSKAIHPRVEPELAMLLAGAATAAERLPPGGQVQAEVAGLGRVSFRVEEGKR